MTCFIIALADDHPDTAFFGEMYWCGYVSQGKTHHWIPGEAGLLRAVRFLRHADALNAGVSGPNVPHPPVPGVQPQDWPSRGIKILEINPACLLTERIAAPMFEALD